MTGEPLDVWLYGTHLARLREDWNRNRISLEWTDQAQQRWADRRPLSAKLTVGRAASDVLVRAHLDGLLPEGNARVNHALSAGVAPDDTFALIRAYGRDTPGAAIYVAAGTPDPTSAGRYEALNDGEVAERLLQADRHHPAVPGRATESSTLPGMVPKITLHRADDTWYACKEGAPSTWILKRANDQGNELDGPDDTIDTEVACLDLARRLGLTSIKAEIVDFGSVRAIAVSRYDRQPDRGHARVHQEDLAQALGMNTADPNRKFQWGSTLPSLRHGAGVLRDDGSNPDSLLRLTAFSLLVGNTDLHAKNISFIRFDDGRVALSPAYDIAMHLHHKRDQRRFALDLNSKFLIDELTVDDVIAEGQAWRLPKRRATRVVREVAEGLSTVLADVDRTQHPGVQPTAWQIVERRTADALQRLEELESSTSAPTPPRTRRGPRRVG